MISVRRMLVAYLAPLALLASACGASSPTPELVDARRSYEQLRISAAAQVAPSEVFKARDALRRAEAAQADDPGSAEARTFAYVAQRRAQLAAANAQVIAARRDQAALEQEYHSRLEQRADHATTAERELDRTRRQLGQAGAQIGQQAQALHAQGQELIRRETELQRAQQQYANAIESLRRLGNVQEEQRGLVLTLSGAVLFEAGRATLLPIANDRLTEVAQAIRSEDPNTSFLVVGHTDSRGSTETNQRLSESRAEAVRMFLVTQGIPSDRIRSQGMGESQPITTNDTPEGRANNRRVEIIIEGAHSGSEAPGMNR